MIMVDGRLGRVGAPRSARQRVLWRSPWAWPAVAIVLAAVSGQWLGGGGALAVLAIVTTVAMLGVTGLTASLVKLLAGLWNLLVSRLQSHRNS